MADAKSDYCENAVVLHVVGDTQFTMPTTHLALFTTSASLANLEAGTLTGEVSGGNYSRVALAGKWGTPSDGTLLNDTEIAFATASADWGTIRFFAIMDAASAGNVLYYGQLTADKDVDNGDTAKFAVSALSITEE